MQLHHFQNEFPYQVKALLSAKKADRLAHAFIVQSDDTKLAADFATALAQAVTCPSPRGDGDSCGACLTCRQIENRSYSELYTLAPVSKSREILIGKDDMDLDTTRWFQSKFHMKSSIAGGIKTGIVYEADCMNAASQNCFLKTLEEPPPSSFLLLLTSNPFSFLPTIRSRCQTILLLRNKTVYDDENILKIIPVLRKLLFSSGTLSSAEECACTMISISNGLRDMAEEKITGKWEKLVADSKNLEPSAQKQIQKRMEAAVASEFIRMRDSMLSLIHAWSAQACMISSGIPMDSLANPEMFSGMDNSLSDSSFKKAYKMMRKSEELLKILQWNVNTDLALREFCLDVVLGK
ncbi:MAG TPA: hypothetical protein DET40_15740 [Lentisphaeria bacterium]|nr:MAG: hypothetical protein A2X45_14265 [Lentisphaerae bacterium GWF2_50_93]HCE44992.1 hypothetical protein [Lentisphaeria bacterium]